MSGTRSTSLHTGGLQCMHCMQSATARKPTISLRLPRPLLDEIDELVRRTRMRSRTEFLERVVESYVDELREARVVVVKSWTDGKARNAILRYLKGRRATYVTDVAEALGMDLDLAFRVVGSLAKEGRVVE
ncbi:MAG TPA: ribbon-helix-helix domain-containing protein [Thermoplasmata archaeon]|nr:ribbon-helix-helix domain-containing protein [Thermoplasmata archaeon]